MSSTAISPAGPATIVDCPLCDAPMPFDALDDAVGCVACGVTLPLADGLLPVRSLAAAA